MINMILNLSPYTAAVITLISMCDSETCNIAIITLISMCDSETCNIAIDKMSNTLQSPPLDIMKIAARYAVDATSTITFNWGLTCDSIHFTYERMNPMMIVNLHDNPFIVSHINA